MCKKRLLPFPDPDTKTPAAGMDSRTKNPPEIYLPGWIFCIYSRSFANCFAGAPFKASETGSRIRDVAHKNQVFIVFCYVQKIVHKAPQKCSQNTSFFLDSLSHKNYFLLLTRARSSLHKFINHRLLCHHKSELVQGLVFPVSDSRFRSIQL